MVRPIDAYMLVLVLVVSSGCTELTRPLPHKTDGADVPHAFAAAARPADATSPEVTTGAEARREGNTAAAGRDRPAAAEPTAAPAPLERIGASHILVSYRGATRARSTVTRTREEARQLAHQLRQKALQPATDFARLALEASDGPSGIEGGALPKFRRQQMVKPFSDAAFALKPGELSDVVETNFGFHIIKRTE